MKKLIAILAIALFCASFIHAENVPIPFKFGFQSTMKVTEQDEWHPGWMVNNHDPVGSTPMNDAAIKMANLEAMFLLTATASFGQIYTLTFSLSDNQSSMDVYANGSTSQSPVGSAGPADNTAGVLRAHNIPMNLDAFDENRGYVTFNWGNKFALVKDALNLNVDAGWVITWDSDTANRSLGGYDRALAPIWYTLYIPQVKVEYEAPITIGLSGNIKSAGFSWKASETARLIMDSQFYRANDPKGATEIGEPYGTNAAATTFLNEDGTVSATGKYRTITANYGDRAFGGFVEAYILTTNVNLAFEFFHFFAPANIKCTFRYDHVFNFNAPISYYYEIDKEMVNDIQPALEFGFGDFNLYLGGRVRLFNYLNSSAPTNGSAGSDWLYDGSAIQASSTTAAASGVKFASPSHEPSAMKIGPQIGFSVSKDWISIGAKWNGYYGPFWYDWQRDGSVNYWRNDFEFSTTIKL